MTDKFHESWLKPEYNEIHNACYEAAELMKVFAWRFDRIIAIQRGGMLPALILSHLLNDIPVTVISYSSKHGQGDDKQHTNELPKVFSEERVLIVDDICDSGNTLYEVKSHCESNGQFAYVFALYYKRRATPIIIPDFKWRVIPEDAGWVNFPYERNERLSHNV